MNARVPLNPTFLALALAIVAASALSLWWLLRRESRSTLLTIAVLTSLALALRLAYTTDYPRGLNEDEPKVLFAAARAVANGTVLAESNISVPVIMHSLFQAQLIPLLGPGRWAIRGYSLVGGLLCVPAVFAAARALRLSVAPSLAASGLIAVLPWALFYSRVMQGAELTFQQLLLIVALARLVFEPRAFDPRASEGAHAESIPPAVPAGGPPAVPGPLSVPGRAERVGWREWALGSFALTWLLYGYWCTRAMLGMTLVAAVLATGRRRLWCLAIAAVALLLYAPYLVANRDSMFIAQGVNPLYYANFGNLQRFGQRGMETLSTFVWPVAEDGWLTIRAAALHPPFLLLLAAFGALSGVRRALFLLAGFFGGLAPAVLAWGAPSVHRMMMAFPFVVLAASCALEDLAVWRRVRPVASAVLVLAVGWYSVRLYFSDDFWPTESRWQFNWPTTALVESLPLPPSPPVILMQQTTAFRYPRMLVGATDQELDADNWFPTEQGGVYGFTHEGAPLRAFYESLLGPRRVESFGPAFKVTFEPGDWSWLRRHGWSYEVRCGKQSARGQVPVLFQTNFGFTTLACQEPAQHTWRTRWAGPSTPVRLRAGGAVAVDAGSTHLESAAGIDSPIDFTAEPGMEIRVTITTPAFTPSVYASLLALTPAGERLPAWEWAVPEP